MTDNGSELAPTGRGTSLYDDVEGLDGLRRLSDNFYDRVLADPILAPVFVDFTPTHLEHVAVWLAEVFGGPADFTARLGGHQALLHSHLGIGMHDAHRQRWLELMADAIADTYPGRTDLSAALMTYFDWGAAIAQDVSQEPVGTDVGEPGPTPRWGWDGQIS